MFPFDNSSLAWIGSETRKVWKHRFTLINYLSILRGRYHSIDTESSISLSLDSHLYDFLHLFSAHLEATD